MKPEDRDSAYLWDMRKFAGEAYDLLSETSFEALEGDWMRKLALERVLELLGEAARRVSTGIKNRYARIDWRALIGQRNVLAHEYGKIDHKRLYDTTIQVVPGLIVELDRILAEAS